MAKQGRDHDKFTDAEWNVLVRNLIQTVAKLATRNPGAAKQLANATNLSESAIAQMKASGKAGPTSFIRTIFFLAGLSDKQAKALLENPATILKNLEPPSKVEALFNEVRTCYSDNELTAWLKLLKSKHQVEEQLGITVSARAKSGGSLKKSSDA